MWHQNLLSRITIDPEICHGKPCVRGLRYPVETLLELLSSGMTSDQILADYEDDVGMIHQRRQQLGRVVGDAGAFWRQRRHESDARTGARCRTR